MTSRTDQRLEDTLAAIYSERKIKLHGLTDTDRENMRAILTEILALPRGSVRDERARNLLAEVLDEVTEKRIINQEILTTVKTNRAEKRRVGRNN
jgi:hypothetical protein